MSKEDKVLNNAIRGIQPMVVAVYSCPIDDYRGSNLDIVDFPFEGDLVLNPGDDTDINNIKQEPESKKLVIDDFELKVKSAYNLFKNNLISKDEYIKIMDTIVK